MNKREILAKPKFNYFEGVHGLGYLFSAFLSIKSMFNKIIEKGIFVFLLSLIVISSSCKRNISGCWVAPPPYDQNWYFNDDGSFLRSGDQPASGNWKLIGKDMLNLEFKSPDNGNFSITIEAFEKDNMVVNFNDSGGVYTWTKCGER